MDARGRAYDTGIIIVNHARKLCEVQTRGAKEVKRVGIRQASWPTASGVNNNQLRKRMNIKTNIRGYSEGRNSGSRVSSEFRNRQGKVQIKSATRKDTTHSDVDAENVKPLLFQHVAF